MTTWIRWTAPAVAIMSIAQLAHAVQYLTIGAAQKLAFPSATRFAEAHVVYRPSDIEAIQRLSGQSVRTRGEQVWKAYSGERLIGFFVVDYVIGKHLVIDYSVSLDADGRVRRVDVLEYRESDGGEIRGPSWLAQFIGKSSGSTLELNKDIRNISGATLSSRHVTQGVKRSWPSMKSASNKLARARPLLGTFVEMTAAGAPPRRMEAAIEAAFAVVERVHRRMSFHDPASDVSRLNRAASAGTIMVDDWTYGVLETALDLHRRSNGVFDIAVAPVCNAWACCHLPESMSDRAQERLGLRARSNCFPAIACACRRTAAKSTSAALPKGSRSTEPLTFCGDMEFRAAW